MTYPDDDKYGEYSGGENDVRNRPDNTVLKIAFTAILSCLLTLVGTMLTAPKDQVTKDQLTEMSQNFEKEITNVEAQQAAQQAQLGSIQTSQTRTEVQMGKVLYKLDIPAN